MENNVIIEQMTSKDIDGVFEVEKNCFEHHWSKDAFKKELNNEVARYLVAKLDGKVVGYVGIWFVMDDIRFIILDTNIRPDGVHFSEDDFDWSCCIIPDEQLQWLKEQLRNKKRTFIFTHANLYFDPNDEHAKWYQVQNHEEVVNILADAACVDTVFQGHHHTYWTGAKQGIRFVNISSPECSPEYTDNDFPIIEITDDAVIYNGTALV